MSLAALLRAPSPELAAGERTHVRRTALDPERARAQHAGLVRALEGLGVRTRVLPALPGHPDACFLEDAAILLDDVVVLTRPGAASRRGEVAHLEPEVAPLRELERVEGDARTLEGGDVLCVDGTLFTGLSRRTNHAGMKELAHRVLGHGYRVKAVEVRGALHLKTAVTWLGEDALLANPKWVDLRRFHGFRVLEVDPAEPFGANVLRLPREPGGPARALLSSAYPRTLERVRALAPELDLEVTALDVSEFHAAEGGLTCLVLPYRDDPGAGVEG